MYDAVVSTAAGLLGMLPKGLVLLISIGLAAGIIRLSKQNVLVQDLYSLENLAHVDVICLDKTGTLTQGRMQVEQAIVLDSGTPVPFETMMGAFLCNTDDNNATFQAMKEYFQPVEGVDRCALVQSPIISAGDVCGSLLLLAGDAPGEATETEVKLVQVGAAFLGRQMEE